MVIGEGCQTGALAFGRVAQPLPCCLAKVSQGLNNLISCFFPMHISCILSMGQSQLEVRGSLCNSWSSVSQAQSRRETRVWIWRGKWKISCILILLKIFLLPTNISPPHASLPLFIFKKNILNYGWRFLTSVFHAKFLNCISIFSPCLCLQMLKPKSYRTHVLQKHFLKQWFLRKIFSVTNLIIFHGIKW